MGVKMEFFHTFGEGEGGGVLLSFHSFAMTWRHSLRREGVDPTPYISAIKAPPIPPPTQRVASP